MTTFETTFTIYPKILREIHASVTDADIEAVNLEDAFEGELGWVSQSGIHLKDYVFSFAEDDGEFVVNALFEVDEDVLLTAADVESVEDAFANELAWIEESGIYLREVKEHN